MKLVPEDLYQALEFDKILKLTEKYCYGELGKIYFNNLIPSNSKTQIEQWLNEVAQYAKTADNNHNFPVAAYMSIREELKMLSIDGYVLSVEGFRNIANILLLSFNIYAFFSKKKSTKSLYPALYDIIRVVDFDKSLLDEIQQVIDKPVI